MLKSDMADKLFIVNEGRSQIIIQQFALEFAGDDYRIIDIDTGEILANFTGFAESRFWFTYLILFKPTGNEFRRCIKEHPFE